jgi:hypothetical protein
VNVCAVLAISCSATHYDSAECLEPRKNVCLIITSFTSCVWPHTTRDMITVNYMWPPSVQNHLKYLFMYKNHWWKYLKFRKINNKNVIVQKLWWWKNFDWIFGFSLKSYVRNTINLSCAKILLNSVIGVFVGFSRILLLEVLIFKGLTALRLYKSFGVKGLIR